MNSIRRRQIGLHFDEHASFFMLQSVLHPSPPSQRFFIYVFVTVSSVCDEETMRMLREAKKLMDKAMSLSDAFGRGRNELGAREERYNY